MKGCNHRVVGVGKDLSDNQVSSLTQHCQALSKDKLISKDDLSTHSAFCELMLIGAFSRMMRMLYLPIDIVSEIQI